MKWLTCLASVLLLSACVQAPVDQPPAAERPVSEASPASPLEEAAKKHVELGLAYIGIARYDVALDEGKLAARIAPGYAPAYHLMGIVYLYIEDVANAGRQLEQALALAPNDPEINNSYGWWLCLSGKRQAGFERLMSSARNPYFRYPTRPYTNAGRCLILDGNYADAEEQFRRAVQADPSNGEAQFYLADLAFRRGDADAANVALVALHRTTEPTAASAWLGLRVARKLGNREAEASYASRLKSRFPDSREAGLLARGAYE